MRTVYDALNAVEAHMVQEMLKQEGIAAYILGEHLQGAIGELPAAGLVRIQVEDADFGATRDFIDRWEAATPKVESVPLKPQKSNLLRGFLIGASLASACAYAYFQTPVTQKGVDYDKDGTLDETWTYSASGVALRYEVDRNLDKKIDLVTIFDRHGNTERVDSDDNFDGKFETRTHYRDGNPQISETDTDNDGFPDLRTLYKSGVISSVEFVDPRSGSPLRVEYLKLGKLVSAELDTNGDGKLDTRRNFSALGEISSSHTID